MDLGGGPRMLLSKTDIDVRELNEPISGGNAPYNDVEEVVIVLLDTKTGNM